MNHTGKTLDFSPYSGDLSLSASYNKKLDWDKLFGDLCSILDTDKGFMQVHNYTESRMVDLFHYYQIRNLGNTVIIPIKVKGVRPLTSITEAIADKIRTAGFSIEKRPNAYKIKVLDNIHDVVDNFEHFLSKRNELKSLFPQGTFKGFEIS